MFGVLYAAEGTERVASEAVAREFSPRIEVHADREITLDLRGLSRLFGDARAIAEELRRTAADRGLRVRVAIAGTRAAARLLVRYRAGITVVEPGTEAEVLAPLPLGLLDALVAENSQLPTSNSQQKPRATNHQPPTRATSHQPPTDTLRRWGLRTLGELAALPADDVAARLGRVGVEWQRLARGEDPRPLVPAVPEERFEQALDLEWPIEGLEPLSFVFGRLMEPLEAHLARRDRGAAVLHVRLHLVTRTIHERSLQLPAPMRDARALRTLALLDLEFHPPDAAIDRVVVAVDPTPGRVVQFSLLTRPLPSPEQLSTLMARLTALMGEGRCGSPAPVDTWQPGAFAMQPFAPRDSSMHHPHEPRRRGNAENKNLKDLRDSATPRPVAMNAAAIGPVDGRAPSTPRTLPALPASLTVGLRRFRHPVPARVKVEEGAPARVTVDRRGFSSGRVTTAAGPWRTSGAWWCAEPWDHDEWDVALHDGTTYRVFRERDADRWFVEGLVD